MIDLLPNLSWPLKLKLLKPQNQDLPIERREINRPVGFVSLVYKQDKNEQIRNENQLKQNKNESIPIDHETALVKDETRHNEQILNDKTRRNEEKQENPPTPKPETTDMRLKLFKLMYESVRDSDLKAKRAELIRDQYKNSTIFEIGYLMGDVTDKFSIMSDIAATLKRFEKEWKPIEHINAYEQIANLGVEVNQLIEMVRVVNKKNAK